MKEIHVPLWDHGNCNGALQAQFGPAYTLPASAICAGAEGRDACDVSINFTKKQILSVHFSLNFNYPPFKQGDGGGPLVCEKGGQWYQVKIFIKY